MTEQRFLELLNGPLYNPIGSVMVKHLVTALRAVIAATGKAGEKAFEDHCAARKAQELEYERESRGRAKAL